MNHTEMAAVARYPSLARLIDLRQSGGWVFQPVVTDGAVELLAGWRVWLPGGWSDSIAIRSETDAKAVRCEPDGGIVWNIEGTLRCVLDELIELRKPGEPGAPALVIGRRPTLWVPGMPLA